jgi:hypothetical protein
VQADRRLVEHVDDAGEFAADLAREADALAFAARERRRRAVEGEIRETHVHEEAQTVADLLEQLGRNRRLGALELQVLEERRRVAHRQRVSSAMVLPSSFTARASLRTRWPFAGGAGTLREEALVVLAHVLGLRLLHAPQHRVAGDPRSACGTCRRPTSP